MVLVLGVEIIRIVMFLFVMSVCKIQADSPALTLANPQSSSLQASV